MNVNIGDQLGPYRVAELIGAGGMGRVYRAHDPRVGRDVAIKVSEAQFNDRFLREAQAIAALNHPNICHLYDVGPNYLVMELVEGETLAERLRNGAIPLDEALGIARQIADALDAAHEKGIVHRDLKPGNVKITPNGAVKVLDFGLAQTRSTAAAAASDDSPTLATGPTEPGVILGTAAYMPPEQAKGKTVDKRADVWAFGVVLYEMVTGQRLFRGESMTEVLASVLKEEPRWDRVPPQVQRLLRKCLEKDPQQRLRHIGDAMALVDDAAPAGEVRSVTPGRRWLWPAVAAIAIIVAAVAFWAPWKTPANLQAVRFEIQSTDQQVLITGAYPMVSPNGRWVVFPATGQDGMTRMWLRSLDSVEIRPLPGTESANNLPPPVFWSPDSRYIAFGSTPGPFAPGQLKKLDISGGPAQVLCATPAAVPRGAWNSDNVIVFAHNSPRSGLLRVSAAGGEPTPVTALNAARQELRHAMPQFLPDGKHFIYFRFSPTHPEYTGIYVGSIDVKPEEQSLTPLLVSQRQAMYAPPLKGGPGYLLFMREATLFAQPFDADRLMLSGEAIPIADQVGSFAPAQAGLFSVSETGVLSYRVGPGGSLSQLALFDEQGKVGRIAGETRAAFQDPRFSPDGKRIAVSQLDLERGSSNIWVIDLERGATARLTFNSGADRFPTWSPDGKTIVYTSNRAGHFDLYEKPSDGSGEEKELLKSDHDKIPQHWSKDARFLLYTDFDTKTGDDIWVLPMTDRKPMMLLRTDFQETVARFSPDGRWIAYRSDESGTGEIYVRPFALDNHNDGAAGGKWMLSKGGGNDPRWRADGKALFFTQSGTRQMMVDINADKTFLPGTPRRLFDLPGLVTSADAAADGKSFLIAMPEAANAQTPMIVVLNWQAALKK